MAEPISISVPDEKQGVLVEIDECATRKRNRSRITIEAWELWLEKQKEAS